MKKIALTLATLLSFGGCSFSKPPNDWQYKSAAYFHAYQENFLSARTLLARGELQRAKSYAKQSADLETLARVYLGESALEISVGIKNSCQSYQEIADLISNKELDAYAAFLTQTLREEQISYLPKQYREFAFALTKEHYKEAKELLFEMQKVSSTLLAAALIKEHLDDASRLRLIELSSYYGYKQSLLFWLYERKKYLTQGAEIAKIDRKIAKLK